MARRSWGCVEQRGESWEVRFLHPKTGKRTRKVVGHVGEMSEQQANEAADALRFRLTGERAAEAGATFAQFLDRYADAFRARVEPETFEGCFAQFRRVAGFFAGIPMECIGPAEARSLLTHLALRGWRGRPLHPNTVISYKAKLAGIWGDAMIYGFAVANPWPGAKVARPDRTSKRALRNLQEVERLYAALPGDMRVFVAFMAEAALRRGEVLRLRWSDVSGGKLHVRESKNGYPRTFRIPARLAPFIEEHAKARGVRRIGADDLLFPGYMETKKDAARELRRFQDAAGKAGLGHLTFHHLRHSVLYRMAEHGANEEKIAKVAGHRSLAATRIYTDHHPESMADAGVDVLDRAARAHEQRPSRQTG